MQPPDQPEQPLDNTGTDESERPPDPAPFAPAPRDLPRSDRGCSRMAFAGCGLLALVIGLGVLTMIIKANDLVGWSLKQIRSEVERTLPDDLPAADRQRLGAAFDAALERIDSGAMDPVAFQALQTELLRFARRTETPTADDVRDLAEALEAFASGEGAPPADPDDTRARQTAWVVR
jgi:hypothetical protein